ncbi:MAG: DUF3179 domain-containing protein [Acidimicrobiia bacterium]|nr:DUF3179 domain-containing protein [Acidimicrobiia bacterium]
MSVVVDLGTDSAAYRIPSLREVGVVNDVAAGLEIAVEIDPNDAARWAVFSRRLDTVVVDLRLTANGLFDSVSRTVLDPFLGIGRSGPLADQTLDRLPGFTSFPTDYLTFLPEGRTWPK